MKKVLFTATVDSHILQFHIPYLKMFKEKGYEVHVATNGTEKIPYCDVKHTVCFERSPIKFNNLRAIKQLKKIIADNQFELIHCHTPMGSVVTRIAAKKERKKGTKVIYTAHGFHFFKGAPLLNWIIFYPIEKYLSKYTDCLITINEEDYNLAKKKFNKCKQIELVHGVGIDEERFNFEMSTEEKHKLRESIGLKDNDFVLIQVGELNKNKNQIMSIKAMRELVKEYSNIHLVLVGKGKLESYYSNKIEEYNLQRNIHMLGYRTDIPQLLKISNVLLSLSYREGLPVNVIEAMVCGLPIIATDCRGNRDLIIDNKESYLVKKKDINDLKNKIELEIKDNIKEEADVKRYLKTEIKRNMKEIYNSVTKTKILHLLSTSEFSGAENVVCQIINMFSNEKNFEMVYCSPNGKIRKELEQKEVKYIPIKKMKYNEIKNVVKKYKPDIIHAHDIRASIFASFFSKYAKIISHIHGNHIFMRKPTIKSILYGLFTSRFSHIYWVSKSSFDNYVFKNVVNEKSSILYNVIDEKTVIEKALREQSQKYDIVFIGRLSNPKNPNKLIDVIKILVLKKGNLRCAIVGDGELKEEIKNKIEKMSLNKNIELLGYMSNPYSVLANSKILIMTSKHEGLPMVVLEALALGVPIVSTPVDGISEVLSGEIRFLTEDNEELAKNAYKIITNNQLRRNISKECKKRFNEINNKDNYKRILKKDYLN